MQSFIFCQYNNFKILYLWPIYYYLIGSMIVVEKRVIQWTSFSDFGWRRSEEERKKDGPCLLFSALPFFHPAFLLSLIIFYAWEEESKHYIVWVTAKETSSSLSHLTLWYFIPQVIRRILCTACIKDDVHCHAQTTVYN